MAPDVPEIDALREQAKRNTYTARRMHVQLSTAEELLRTALDRVRAEHAEIERLLILETERQVAREIVEALGENAPGYGYRTNAHEDGKIVGWDDAVAFVESRYIRSGALTHAEARRPVDGGSR